MPATSILTFADRARSRFSENVRQAKLEGASTATLGVLIDAVVAGELAYPEANERVLALRREQRAAA